MLAKQYAATSRAVFNHCPPDKRNVLKARRIAVDKACAESCRDHPNCNFRFCKPFQPLELEAALAQAGGGAPGPDGITTKMLQELGPSGKAFLLKIANKSLKKRQVPTIWRRATIVAIPKPGKPKDDPKSFRPISLTSCVGKIVERLIQGRIQHLLETTEVLAPEQAGFRASRSTEEQITRLAQTIMDSLEKPKMERTVLASIDLTAAYDRVHKDSLLLKMTDLNIPPCMIRWVRSFLADRRARVRWNDTFSREVKMSEGLPQGAVCSPMLWLCYANDLAPVLKRQGVDIGMYADDLDISHSHRDIDTATAKVQAALDELEEWADTWHMNVSETKSKTILFSTHRDEVNSKRPIHLCLGNQVLEQVSEVSVLGVKFDTQLSFRPHITNTKTKVDKRISAMKALAGTRWGCRENTMRKLYKTFVQPVALYGCGTYMQFASATNRDIMNRTARAAARVITGCPADTRTETLMSEAQIRDVSSMADEIGAIQREKLLRLDGKIPANKTAKTQTKRRLKNRGTWRERAEAIAQEANLETIPREEIKTPNQNPWDRVQNDRVTICTRAADLTSRSTQPNERREAFEKVIEELPAVQSTYFTDGSTARGFGAGGGGITRLEPEGRGPRTWSVAAGDLTSSFRSELAALNEALNDADGAPASITKFRICTDSLSLLQKLREAPWKRKSSSIAEAQDKINKIAERGSAIQLVWVPGHAGVAENEAADGAANAGRDLNRPEHPLPIDVTTAKASIKEVCRRRWAGSYNVGVPPDHPHRRISGGKPPAVNKLWKREEQVVFHQLRVNRCPRLADTLRRWRRPGEDGLCPHCGEIQDTEHYITTCPKHQHARTTHLGPVPDINILQEDPEAVMKFIRASGLLRGAQ